MCIQIFQLHVHLYLNNNKWSKILLWINKKIKSVYNLVCGVNYCVQASVYNRLLL